MNNNMLQSKKVSSKVSPAESLDEIVNTSFAYVTPPSEENPFGRSYKINISLEDDIVEIPLERNHAPYLPSKQPGFAYTFTVPNKRVVLVSKKKIEDDHPILKNYEHADSIIQPLPICKAEPKYHEVLQRTISSITRIARIKETRSKQHTRRFRRLALTDELTKLPNLRSFRQEIVPWMKRAAREQGNFYVLFVDAKEFGKFNKLYDWNTGSAAIVGLGKSLRKGLRASDYVCRYGGDEFVALVKSDDIERVCDRIQEMVGTVRIDNPIYTHAEDQGLVDRFFEESDRYLRIGVDLGYSLISPALRENGAELREMNDSVYVRIFDDYLRKAEEMAKAHKKVSINPSAETHRRTLAYREHNFI
ncbi:GGDEF domain-containing protein [Candidatus Woesearchaeota archaeon]|nr:MAG: GGDEF domain-containing protein [Candidatus Woesearchaeota archaeon]